ncbi:MAG: MMPL family transporter [bacterium]|nr:MMPL family transporter [bacterium]
MQAWFSYFADITYRRYPRIIILSTLLTLFCSYFVYQLIFRLETDIAALIPKSYPSVKTLEDIKNRVGGVGSLLVLVECEDFQASQKFVDDLALMLQQEEYWKYVNYVDYQKDVDFFKRNALLYMDLVDLEEIQLRIEDRIAQEKLKLSPLYIRLDDGDDADEELSFSDIAEKYKKKHADGHEVYYTNPDSSIVGIEVVASGTVSNIGFAKEMYSAIQRAVQELKPETYHPRMTVSYGGTFKNKIDEYDVIWHDIKSTLLVGVIGVVLILTFYFRQPLAVFFVAIPLIMGLSWAFAITYWVVGNLNTMTGFLFVILFGLGIDFGIHMFARYLEDRMAHMDVRQSIGTMLSQTGQAIMTAALTTSMAFYSLTITDFKGFSEFGFIVGTGILTSLVAMTTVLPAFLVLADRKLGLIRMRHVLGHDWGNGKGRFPLCRTVLVVGLLVTLYLGFNLHHIKFEYDFTNLRSNLPASRVVKAKINTIAQFSKESQSPSVVLADSKADLDEIVQVIEAKIASDDPTPTIDKIRTLWAALPEQQDRKMEIIEEIRRVANGEGAKLLKGEQKERLDDLRDLLDVTELDVEDLPKNVLRKFATVDGSRAYFAFIFPSVQLRDGKNAMAFSDDSHVIQAASGKVFYSSSSSIIFADMLRLMIRDSRIAVSVSLVVVFLIVVMDFRSLHKGLLVMLPLACGAVWMCGTMFVADMKLNFYNIVALPTIIGMGIDNGVHLYHRYQEEGKGSMLLVLKSTGGAMFVSMLTTMVGFFGLMTATHPGLNSIGKLAIIGLMTCFVAAVVLLPALLQVLEDRQQKRLNSVVEPVDTSQAAE